MGIMFAQDNVAYYDGVTAKYFTDGAANLAGELQQTGHLLLTVYIMLIGWSMMRGLISEPVLDTVIRIIKAALIITFATDSTIYAADIASFLSDWPSALLGKLNGTDQKTIAQSLDTLADSGYGVAEKAYETADVFTNFGGYLLWLGMLAITTLIIGVALFLTIGAKVGLAILLTLGPIFIILMLFDSTRDYFNRWFSACVTFGLTIVIVGMTAMISIKYLGGAVEQASNLATGKKGVVTAGSIIPAVIAGIESIFLMISSPVLAGTLGGGISTVSTAGLNWAYNNTKRAAPAPFKLGKAGYKAYQSAQGVIDRSQQKNSIQGSRHNIYRKITGQSRHRATAA